MSWERCHRRYRLRHAVLDEVVKAGPIAAVSRARAEIDAEYGGLGAFLLEVQAHWERAEQARLEEAADTGEAAIVRARLASEQSPTRILLDAFAAHLALAQQAHHAPEYFPPAMTPMR